jgi:hypothetical protein
MEERKMTDAEMTEFQKELWKTAKQFSYCTIDELDELNAKFKALVMRAQEIPVNKGYTCPKGHHSQWVAVGGPMLHLLSGDTEYMPWCKPCNKYYDKEGSVYE